MKMNRLAIACGAAMLGLSSVAAAEISANIGVTSNYIWRGLTQTGNSTALSGGFDWADELGVYAG
ncbi:MAG: TorF family putative porin, partial [Candidatus Thiodiazotropha sp.]